MQENPNNRLRSLIYPYTFVLQEGKRIKKNLLDYSLIIMLSESSEVIRSPELDPQTNDLNNDPDLDL